MVPLSLVSMLATRWRHLHWFQFWTPGGATWIATLRRIALLTSSVGIELLSSSARVTSVKSEHSLSVTDGRTSGPIDRTPGTPGSDKNSFGQKEMFPYALELPVLNACYNISNTVLAAKANMKSWWGAKNKYFRTRASSCVLWQQEDTWALIVQCTISTSTPAFH